MMRFFCRQILGLFGWTVDSSTPGSDKYVLVGAPHTSNWDFPFAMLARFATEVQFSWVGKHTLFRWPFAGLMRALGGVPVDRSAGAGFVDAAVDMFRRNSHFILAISPEGTRWRTDHWRTGFYQIAVLAQVPIALGFIDYRRRRLGVGPLFFPCGDIERDFALIRDYYTGVCGRRLENQGEIRLKGFSSATGKSPGAQGAATGNTDC